jgi:hypothetical protein
MKLIKLLLILVFFLQGYVYAEDLYYAQSQGGSHNGTSCDNAIALSNIQWGIGVGKVSAGDTLHFCGILTSKFVVGDSGSEGNLITIKFESGSKFSESYWDGNGTININGKSYIVIDGNNTGIIESTNNGSPDFGYSNKTYACAIKMEGGSHDLEIKGLTVENMYIHPYHDTDSTSIGVVNNLASIHIRDGYNISVHNCTISNSYGGIVHTNYSNATLSNINIYNNVISKCCQSIGSSGSGNGSGITNNLKIYNNTITIGNNWEATYPIVHCNATNVNGTVSWTNSQIYNNYIYGNNSTAKAVGNAAITFLYIGPNSTGNIIYNNLIVGGNSYYPSEGFVSLKYNNGGYPSVINNTIIGNNSTYDYGGVTYFGDHIYHSNGGVPEFKNNIFVKGNMGINIDIIPTSDYNIYYNMTTLATISGTPYTTLGDLQTALGGGCPGAAGNECNGSVSNPNLDEIYGPTSSSANVINRGEVLNNLFTADKIGMVRGTSWDIGAYEFLEGITTVWGHVTGVTEPRVRTFVSDWSGNGTISSSGDSEKIALNSTEYMQSTVLYTGASKTAVLHKNKYAAGDNVILKYRTGSTEVGCSEASWTVYSVPFVSLGYIQIRVESTL